MLCSRFVNKHMLQHYQQTNHSVALSYRYDHKLCLFGNMLCFFLLKTLLFLGSSDLSVWCFTCDAYLDAQVIQQLRPVYETAYILKFGEAPPIRTVEDKQN